MTYDPIKRYVVARDAVDLADLPIGAERLHVGPTCMLHLTLADAWALYGAAFDAEQVDSADGVTHLLVRLDSEAHERAPRQYWHETAVRHSRWPWADDLRIEGDETHVFVRGSMPFREAAAKVLDAAHSWSRSNGCKVSTRQDETRRRVSVRRLGDR